jgi:xanthine dehydrogenase accessory factor
MTKEAELWQFISDRLTRDQSVILQVVAESSGSSPGRQGYKMAVAEDGELVGSIGGGVMEVSLVDQSRAILSGPGSGSPAVELSEQVHRKDVRNSSGMICSGRQTVIFTRLGPSDVDSVELAVASFRERRPVLLQISPSDFTISNTNNSSGIQDFDFERISEEDFLYREKLGPKNDLYIIGGGHCALALSELMSKMDFRVHILDDRPELNTIEKNRFADEITIIDSYESIADHVAGGPSTYVAVMTLGYRSDAVVIRKLVGGEFKYFGVLGSRAKMGTLMKELRDEGLAVDELDRIRTPIGLPINSRTPEEIAVSIAAEIISVKNSE